MTVNHYEVEGGDNLTLGNVKIDASPMVELGATGLKRSAGYLNEEFLPALKGRKAVGIYREMSDNDPIIGALLFAVDRLLRQLEWRVEPASQSKEDKDAAEFLESCMEDMSHTWDDFISEILTMLPYGWAMHEVVYKKRVGPWEKDAKKRSKYTDGKIGWRKIPIRSQETLQRWVFDDTGGVKAMVQLAPPKYETTVLPIERCLLFRVTTIKNNPEGRSFLRNAYRPWFYKKRLEEIEGIGVERDLAGLPVAKVPHDYLSAKKGTDKAKMVDAFRKMVRSVRRDEQEGIVIPAAYDQDTKQPLFDFQLLTSGGSRSFNTSEIIQRYEQRMLMTVLADFIMVGHEGTGSYALHTDKSGLFRASINSIAQAIADVLNRYAVPRLFAVNGMKLEKLPEFKPGDVDPPDLGQLGQFMGAMATAGVQWFPDPELEKFIRSAARLPDLDESKEASLETQQKQADIMAVANQKMQMMQMKQQAEQGMMQQRQQELSVRQQELGVHTQEQGIEHDLAQKEMSTQQQAMGIEQQQQQLQQPQPDPREQEALQQAGSEQDLRHKEETHQAKLSQMSDSSQSEQSLRHKEEQHKARLEQMKNREKNKPSPFEKKPMATKKPADKKKSDMTTKKDK